jgi:hypothetical protein
MMLLLLGIAKTLDKVLESRKTMISRSKPLYKVGDITNRMADRDYSKISDIHIKVIRILVLVLNTENGKQEKVLMVNYLSLLLLSSLS